MRINYKKTFKRLLKVFLKPNKKDSNNKRDLFDKVQPFDKVKVDLIRVIDGDTFKLAYQGQNFRARLLIVDTPESVEENHLVMPLGKEISSYSSQRLTHCHRIEIAFDYGNHFDRFGRYLVYLYLDGNLYQTELLKKGYAIVRYVDHDNDSKLNEFLKIQKKARLEKLGVWKINKYVYQNSDKSFNYNKKISRTNR